MPEYIMPIGPGWEDLSPFTQGYIEAAFFSECNSDRPERKDMTFGDIRRDALRDIIRDCERWRAEADALLQRAYERDYTAEQAGAIIGSPATATV